MQIFNEFVAAGLNHNELVALLFKERKLSELDYAHDMTDVAHYAALIRAVNWLHAATPDLPSFAVHLGDAIHAGVHTEARAFQRVSDTLRIPYYFVIGNHDIHTFGLRGLKGQWRQDKPYHPFNALSGAASVGLSPTEEFVRYMTAGQRIRFGAQPPEVKDARCYVLEKPPAQPKEDIPVAFVFIDTVDRRPGVSLTNEGFMRADHREWIARTLDEQRRESKSVILFAHHPMERVTVEGRGSLRHLLGQFSGRPLIYFCGDLHDGRRPEPAKKPGKEARKIQDVVLEGVRGMDKKTLLVVDFDKDAEGRWTLKANEVALDSLVCLKPVRYPREDAPGGMKPFQNGLLDRTCPNTKQYFQELVLTIYNARREAKVSTPPWEEPPRKPGKRPDDRWPTSPSYLKAEQRFRAFAVPSLAASERMWMERWPDLGGNSPSLLLALICPFADRQPCDAGLPWDWTREELWPEFELPLECR